jgi:O-antigen biosynthesis protein
MRFNLFDHPIAATASDYFCPALAWTSHAPFAFLAVELVQPRTLVELGTHYGASYCAFCQAVARLKLPTKCFAVDTWKGDRHIGAYGDDVLLFLRGHHDPRYSSFSTLTRTTFDEAVGGFADGSIDLLHIDGSHTYEDMAHDYQAWVGKLSDRGVILFHDTFEKAPGFGVHRLWAELEPKFPSFEFRHGHGLGVLGVGKNLPAGFVEFLEEARANPEGVREMFAALGRANEAFCELRLATFKAFHTQREINRYKREIGEIVEPNSEALDKALELPNDFICHAFDQVGAMVRHAADLRRLLKAEKK